MKWEYKVLTIDKFLVLCENLTVEEALNKLGQDGWELVGALGTQHITLGNPSKLDSSSIVFKKAIGE